MIKHIMVKINPKMSDIKKDIEEKFQGDFIKYLENVLDKYVNDGWEIISPSIYTNPFGAEIGALLIFQKDC